MEKPTKEEIEASNEYKIARSNKLRKEYNESMERLHGLPLSFSVSTEIVLVTHEYATKVMKILSE